jgi:hypothetical protein
MDININIETIDRYFFSKIKQSYTKELRTKIVNYSFFPVNEANISNKISKISYYSSYFSIFDDYDSLNVSQLNDDIIEKLNLDIEKYLLFKYDDKNSIDFLEYLYSFKNAKKLIFGMISTIQHLLRGLQVLNENNVCFFNLSPQNIIFLENYREKPVLSNFMYSLNLNKLDFNYISNILKKIDFTYQPLEVNILFYFVNRNMITISYSFIEDFCDNYIKNLSILNLFSENYKKTYKEQCIETISKYINKPKNEIIENILERNDKWDVYGISMLYLQIFGCISRVFSLKGTFISKITLELSKNLHPNSDKRMSLEKTYEIFNKLLNEENDWRFVNNLDNNKLKQLFNELDK